MSPKIIKHTYPECYNIINFVFKSINYLISDSLFKKVCIVYFVLLIYSEIQLNIQAQELPSRIINF